ncbi:MAG: DEAD/DEAH box helicase family protein [Sandaracinaceae bacterium]|nr:DEAD/DEAH box helicase family protein [Sandaracinaceae bacterium]
MLDAASRGGLEIVADGRTGLYTRALRDRLAGRRVNYMLLTQGGALFHPKAYLFGLVDERKPREEWRLAIVGSGNLTGGGFSGNEELFVVHLEHAEVAPEFREFDGEWRGHRGLAGWPSLSAALQDYASCAKPVVDWNAMPATAAEGRGANVIELPPVRELAESPLAEPGPRAVDHSAGIGRVLELVPTHYLVDLCRQYGVRGARSREDRIRCLVGTISDPASLLTSLRKEALVEILSAWSWLVGRSLFDLSSVRQANVDTLRAVLHRVAFEGWEPHEPRDTPVQRSGIIARVIGSMEDLEDGSEGDARPQDRLPEVVGSDDPPGTLLQLWEFQQDAIDALKAHFLDRRSSAGVLSLPTGSGKTVTALRFLLERYVRLNQRVVWIAPRVELLNQVHRELLRSWPAAGRPLRVGRVHAGTKRCDGDVVLVTAMALATGAVSARDLQAGGEIGIVCFDEAHRAAAPRTKKALERLRGPRAPLLALTATPFRMGKGAEAELRSVIGPTVYSRSFPELVRDGFLARPILHAIRAEGRQMVELTEKELQEARTMGELPSSVLGRIAKDERRTRAILGTWQADRERKFGKTLIFACNIPHAELIARELRGVGARLVTSKMSGPQVSREIEAFRQDPRGVMVNVSILTEGVDIPDIQTVVLARPTLSKVLYSQMIGRAARGDRERMGKRFFRILDCVDNFSTHGLFQAGLYDELVAEAEDAADPGTKVRRATKESRAGAHLDAYAWAHTLGLPLHELAVWGTLSWQAPSGWVRSLAVFHEKYFLLREAVNQVSDCVAGRTTEWPRAEEWGPRLEMEQAVPRHQWQALVSEVRTTGQVPSFEAWEDDKPAIEQRALEKRAAEIRVELAGVEPPGVATEVESTHSLAVIDAFVELAMRVASSDGNVHPTETLALREGALTFARETEETFGSVLDRSVHQARIASAGSLECAGVLAEALSLEQRVTVLDSLFRVALADGQFLPEEAVLLRKAAEALALPTRLIEERFRWYSGQVSTLHGVDVGYQSCTRCGGDWPLRAKFCGRCGAPLVLEVSPSPGGQAP